MTKVLIVEDEPMLVRTLRISLEAQGYEVFTASGGIGALTTASRVLPDMVVLDLELPDMDGLEVLAGLRGRSSVPVIVLSGRTDPAIRVNALKAGADDYITKPFSPDELLARIRAAGVRHDTSPAATVHRIGSHTVDLAARTVRHDDGSEVRLTPSQWIILGILLRDTGRAVSAGRLMVRLRGPRPGFIGDAGQLRFHMSGLRRKLEADPDNPRHLLTDPGFGYRFRP